MISSPNFLTILPGFFDDFFSGFFDDFFPIFLMISAGFWMIFSDDGRFRGNNESV